MKIIYSFISKLIISIFFWVVGGMILGYILSAFKFIGIYDLFFYKINTINQINFLFIPIKLLFISIILSVILMTIEIIKGNKNDKN